MKIILNGLIFALIVSVILIFGSESANNLIPWQVYMVSIIHVLITSACTALAYAIEVSKSKEDD